MGENDVQAARTQARNMEYSLDALQKLSTESYQKSVGRAVEVNELKMVGESIAANCSLKLQGVKMLKEIG